MTHIEINYYPERHQYRWYICDGPEGIDTHEGFAYTLGGAFEEIIQWRTANALNNL